MNRPVAVCLLLALAGCSGPTLGPEAVPAGIPAEELLAAEYAGPAPVPVPVVYPVGIGPMTVNLTVTSYAAAYVPVDATNGTGSAGVGTGSTATGEGTAALFVLSTPNADVAGTAINPFAHATDPGVVRAVDRVLDTPAVTDVDLPANLVRADETERRVLGTRARVVTYAGTTSNANDGTDAVPVLVHVAAVPHGDDVVVLLAVHDARRDEAGALLGLMERVDHPIEGGEWPAAAQVGDASTVEGRASDRTAAQ